LEYGGYRPHGVGIYDLKPLVARQKGEGVDKLLGLPTADVRIFTGSL